MGLEPSTRARSSAQVVEKDRIGQAAATLIPGARTILLDSGTTTATIARFLPEGHDLTIVTNSVLIASYLGEREDLGLYLLGGRLRSRTQASVGAWGIAALRDINVDIAFVGTNGIGVHDGLTTPDETEAATKRAMVKAAQRVIVVSDHTKVGTTHFARFADLSEVDTLVTDSGLDEAVAVELAAAGPEVIRV